MAVKGKRAGDASAPHHTDPPKASGSSESTLGPEMLVLERDIFGNPYLPGQEVEVIREVYESAHAYESLKVEHAQLTKKLTEEKKKLAGVSRKFRDHFEATSDGLHFTYPCAGVMVKVNRKEEVSTEAESSQKSGGKGKGKGKGSTEDVY